MTHGPAPPVRQPASGPELRAPLCHRGTHPDAAHACPQARTRMCTHLLEADGLPDVPCSLFCVCPSPVQRDSWSLLGTHMVTATLDHGPQGAGPGRLSGFTHIRSLDGCVVSLVITVAESQLSHGMIRVQPTPRPSPRQPGSARFVTGW